MQDNPPATTQKGGPFRLLNSLVLNEICQMKQIQPLQAQVIQPIQANLPGAHKAESRPIPEPASSQMQYDHHHFADSAQKELFPRQAVCWQRSICVEYRTGIAEILPA